MLPQGWNGWKWMAVSWLFLITILFMLPGSALPKENWLHRIHFDKIVHAGFFAVLLYCFRMATVRSGSFINIFLLLLALIYGILIELIQGAWVPNRSSDYWDVAADMAGAIAGLIVWFWMDRKK